MSTRTEPAPLRIIERRRGWSVVDWREIWQYRDLLYFLAWRDIRVRYKQTVLGAAWAVLQPIAAMIVFTLFFGRLSGLAAKTGDVPYALFVYLGLLPWLFVSSAVAASGASLVGNTQLVGKVYFPRVVVPFATIGVSLVDFLVSLVLLAGFMTYYQVTPTWRILATPLFVAGAVLIAAGFGTLLAALTALYRDFRFVIPFMLQIWMFVSPVIYPSTVIPKQWRTLYFLNPVSGLLEGFRAACLGLPFDGAGIGVSAAVAVAVFIAGTRYFANVERRLADVI
jgi:lipopolysaccharide transport system permease protein